MPIARTPQTADNRPTRLIFEVPFYQCPTARGPVGYTARVVSGKNSIDTSERNGSHPADGLNQFIYRCFS